MVRDHHIEDAAQLLCGERRGWHALGAALPGALGPPQRRREGRQVNENPVLLFARALDFAARKHMHQRRKGELAEPYVNHLSDVARLLAEATGGDDVTLVIAGLLHDTIEDTDTTSAELATAFGAEVAALVGEVTDDKTLPKSERKRLQVETAPHKSARARMIKLADKTSNLHSMIGSPPKDWSLERKRDYIEWAEKVVAGCRGVSAYLEQEFERARRKAKAALKA
jgi:(p)ppGpp synthase/HD superfamily hydrolase